MLAVKPQLVFYRGHTHGELSFPPSFPIAKTIGDWCRKFLTEKEFIPEGYRWNKELHCRVKTFAHWELTKQYCFYDRKTMRLHVPIGFADDLKQLVENNGGVVKELPLPGYPMAPLKSKIKPGFSDRPWQVELIEKCSEKTPGMKGLNMQVGKGKTYSAIRSALNLGYATMVIVPGLVDQWLDSFMEFTPMKCKSGELYKITGFDSINRLAKCPGFRPAVFVASTRTMQMFCNKEENYGMLPWTFEQFFKTYGIGCKIIDECHKNFHANTMMDLRLNVPYNLYCSATFSQTNKHAREIFVKIFPKSMRYGASAYDRYTRVFMYQYSGEVDERKCIKHKGYMHAKYEHELLHSDRKLTSHIMNNIVPRINEHYVERFKPGYKMLLFCSSIEFIEAVAKKLKDIYKDFRVITYTGSDKQEKLKSGDIIVTNMSKAGTGLDLKNLITSINTVSLRSEVLAEQVLGRLRKMDNEEVRFIDMFDVNLQSHIRHADERRELWQSICSKYQEEKIFPDFGVVSGSQSSIPSFGFF